MTIIILLISDHDDAYSQIKRTNVRTIIEAMALCHNVTPIHEEEEAGKITYQV